MAILYTDYLTGNDTTGNGTIATPYKTINKAMTIGDNGDEVRVAGSGFTALSGTVTATINTSTTWNTSVNLTGVLLPGDIITVNDAEFGNEKFFYKVFSVGTTSIVVDGAWNRTANVNLTFSKVTTQHYYTTTASVTFETVNITGKTNFIVRGGWVNSFTEQTGWTIMNYQGATATANSGIGFTAILGGITGEMYFDRFMLSHLTTPFAGSTNRWYPGNLAFINTVTTSPYGAGAVSPHPTYGLPNHYYTNSNFCSALGTSNVGPVNGFQLQFNNIYYSNTASTTAASIVQHRINNMYYRSTFGTGIQAYGACMTSGAKIDNLFIATRNNPGSTENICIFPGPGTPSACSIDNSISVVGPNTSYSIALNTGVGNSFNQITLSTNIEEQFANGIETGLVGQGFPSGVERPLTIVFDSEGEKLVYNNSNIAYADSLVFDTGTNSLRTSKVSGAGQCGIPIYSYYNSNALAKTITIRAKASANTNIDFGLVSTKLRSNTSTTSGVGYNNIETKAITTTWANYTYTGLDIDIATVISNGYIQLFVRTDNMTAKYLWIDSVTVS